MNETSLRTLWETPSSNSGTKYRNSITTRNRYVDYYNALVQDLVDLAGELKKVNQRVDVVKGRLAATSNPGLPAMATFVSALYERAKAECLSDFYLASRAYSFWALDPYSKFYDSLRNPGAITADQLEGAHETLAASVLEALESGLAQEGRYTPAIANEKSIGVVVVLSRESHPDFFDSPEEDNYADLELEPASLASATPPRTFAPTTVAWTGSLRPKFDPSTPHPLHGMANVRLTKARPWIIRLETESGNNKVKLTHLGEERFGRP